MNKELSQITPEIIENRIFNIRGKQVMIDRDLAKIYDVNTSTLNQAVKRNIERFPIAFRFQLTKNELDTWKSQIVISNDDKMDLRKRPYAFTEQGVSMLSAVLRSQTAVKVSIAIMNAFVQMRKSLHNHQQLLQLSNELQQHKIETKENFEKIFDALESPYTKPKQGIFYNGQIFDAYTFIADLIREAQKSIIIIDNYVDDSVLTILSKRNKNVSSSIYTSNISKQLKLDLEKHNKQMTY
jgi:hypothetical protein